MVFPSSQQVTISQQGLSLEEFRQTASCESYGSDFQCKVWNADKMCKALGFDGEFTSVLDFQRYATCYKAGFVFAIPLG